MQQRDGFAVAARVFQPLAEGDPRRSEVRVAAQGFPQARLHQARPTVGPVQVGQVEVGFGALTLDELGPFILVDGPPPGRTMRAEFGYGGKQRIGGGQAHRAHRVVQRRSYRFDPFCRREQGGDGADSRLADLGILLAEGGERLAQQGLAGIAGNLAEQGRAADRRQIATQQLAQQGGGRAGASVAYQRQVLRIAAVAWNGVRVPVAETFHQACAGHPRMAAHAGVGDT